MTISVKGRAAFVTGGASGIGLGLAEELLKAGAQVAIADVNSDAVGQAVDKLNSLGKVKGIVLDVRDRGQWRAAKTDAEGALGPVSILVNNAGVTDYDAILDARPENFDWVMGVNVAGVFNGVQCFGRDMVARGDGGHIVNTASIAGLYGSHHMTVGVYCASKFAVVGLSERLRIELAPHGIGVSVLCPGLVASNIGANTAKLRPLPPGVDLQDNPVFKNLRGGIPMPRLEPERLGAFIIEAIEQNRANIIPHPHFGELVEERHRAIMADFRDAADPDLPVTPNWRELA